METIVIIGSGFCGVMTAINLIKYSNKPLKISLIESKKEFAKGIAYSTNNNLHLLNVPAIKMSAFHDIPGHFYEWLCSNREITGITPDSNSFVPRKIYGMYLESTFNEYKKIAKAKNIELVQINDKATDICKTDNYFEISFKNQQNIICEKVVLATGNFTPGNINIKTPEFYKSKNYFQDPWSDKIFNEYNKDMNILLIGSGLTMVDLVISLYEKNHQGKIYVISPHGYIPKVHKKTENYPVFFDHENLPKTALEVFKIVRNEINKAKKNGINWRSVVDSIRPFTQEIWKGFSISEKKQFMKYLRHKWGVMRHRMPSLVANIFYGMLDSKQVEVFAGKINDIVQTDNAITVNFISSVELTGLNQISEKNYQLIVQKVINCTGPQADINKIDDQLIQNLIKSGIIRSDSLHLGIDTTNKGNVINSDNNIENNIFTLGTNLKGILWESTAVPELRLQACNISKSLINI